MSLVFLLVHLNRVWWCVPLFVYGSHPPLLSNKPRLTYNRPVHTQVFITLLRPPTNVVKAAPPDARMASRQISVLQLAVLQAGVLLAMLLIQTPNPSQAFLLPKIIRQGRVGDQQPQLQLRHAQIYSPTSLYASEPKRLTITEQLKFSPNRWKRNGEPLEPGYGGIWPGNPDAKTYKVNSGAFVESGSCGFMPLSFPLPHPSLPLSRLSLPGDRHGPPIQD